MKSIYEPIIEELMLIPDSTEKQDTEKKVIIDNINEGIYDPNPTAKIKNPRFMLYHALKSAGFIAIADKVVHGHYEEKKA